MNEKLTITPQAGSVRPIVAGLEDESAKPSPGEWRYSTIQLHNPERVVVLADDREIARIEACSVWDVENEPNLDLIISAPHLLRERDALRDALEQLKGAVFVLGLLHGKKYCGSAMEQARAALTMCEPQ